MSTKSRLELIKEAARKYKEEQEFQQAVATVDARRKAAKKLTKSVKKAAHQAPGHTDCFKDENNSMVSCSVKTDVGSSIINTSGLLIKHLIISTFCF